MTATSDVASAYNHHLNSVLAGEMVCAHWGGMFSCTGWWPVMGA